MINLLVFTQVAGLTNRLAFNGIIGQIWVLPFLVSLYALDTTTANKWVVWALVSLLLSYPSNHSVQVGESPSTYIFLGVTAFLTNFYYRLGITKREYSPY
jgi:hypothetical protein